jgi:hypothetical protein
VVAACVAEIITDEPHTSAVTCCWWHPNQSPEGLAGVGGDYQQCSRAWGMPFVINDGLASAISCCDKEGRPGSSVTICGQSRQLVVSACSMKRSLTTAQHRRTDQLLVYEEGIEGTAETLKICN